MGKIEDDPEILGATEARWKGGWDRAEDRDVVMSSCHSS
jgi:hypothetical protein